jgi:peptidyl-prolyl cis-trans isomerase B (cyclophilin B)
VTEKNFIIAFITILVVGAAVWGGVTKFKGDLDGISASPSPSASDILFNNGKSNDGANASQSNAQTETKKTVKQYQDNKILNPDQLQNKKAVIETARGKIEFEIYPEATKAASNFVFLAGDGFYNGLTFHRVEPGFVIQGGDPLGSGTGGPGYKFEDEPFSGTYNKGIVAMANAGPNTNGSQFFIMLADHPELPKNYTIFGKVVAGQDVVSKIAVGDVMGKVSIEPLK